jgi:tartrate/fumarate subfamily iron-sulfur-dependent hydro-lyase beta chain
MMSHLIKELETPLSLETVEGLKLGDLVTLNGKFFSCRSKFHAKMVREKAPIPESLKGIDVMCHMGPVMQRQGEGWTVLSAGPTTSFRMDSYGPAMIKRLGLRAIIGKGTMGEKTMAAMRDEKCVHLCSVGMDSNVLPDKIRKVVSVDYLEEFGMIEAVWVFDAKGWGPFMVDIDTTGANYFDHIKKDVEERLREVKKRIGIDPDYQYSVF